MNCVEKVVEVVDNSTCPSRICFVVTYLRFAKTCIVVILLGSWPIEETTRRRINRRVLPLLVMTSASQNDAVRSARNLAP